MLAYRHGFHAGNHADVLKHAVLLGVLDYLQRKPSGITCVDTHAGAVVHELDGPFAQRTREHETGIGRLWAQPPASPLLARYRAAVAAHNPGGVLRRYPGSPSLVMAALRAQDRLRLFELHPTEAEGLAAACRGRHPQIMVRHDDGFAGLKAVLPPPTPRALVLIDPSYEDKRDYTRVVEAVREALRRCATAAVLIWYPLLADGRAAAMVRRLTRLRPSSWLDARLMVRAPSAEGFGMHGSGMFVINPPWVLPGALAEALPELVARLGQDAQAGQQLAYRID